MINISSLHLKTALLYYYRFKRQYICVDECHSSFGEIADVLVDTGKSIYEIEIKLSKADLNKEKKKSKHNPEKYKNSWSGKGANLFYLCVPTELISYAEKWIQEINPKYGLIEFNSERYQKDKKYMYHRWNEFLHFKKRASQLHGNYNKKLSDNIISRLPSALCNAYINQIQLMEIK
jgi:hypothetical protein